MYGWATYVNPGHWKEVVQQKVLRMIYVVDEVLRLRDFGLGTWKE